MILANSFTYYILGSILYVLQINYLFNIPNNPMLQYYYFPSYRETKTEKLSCWSQRWLSGRGQDSKSMSAYIAVAMCYRHCGKIYR